MQRKALRTLFILCKRYHFTPYSSNPSHTLSSKCNLFSTYSHFGSFESNPRRVFDLIHIHKDQDYSQINQPHQEFGDDVEIVFRILNKFTRVSKLELALQESGVVVRPGLTERVLKRCGNAGNLGYRFFAWASKQPGYVHSRDVYTVMIKSLAKMSKFGSVWAVMEEMRKDNSRLLTVEVFNVLMRRFEAARMVKKAIQMLDEMPQCGCETDEYFFGCLLSALCKKGFTKEAAVLFEDMRFHFRPTIRHFTSLLYGWCKEGKIMEAKNVLIKMRAEGIEPDVVFYNILLDGYAAAGKIVDAFDISVEMKKKGCDPNVASFTTMIQSLCDQEKMEEAMRVFSDMNSSGCEADDMTYTTLISGFVKWGEIEKAYSILDQMIQKGLPPSSAAYLYIMSAHEKKQQLEECLELKEEMRKIGLVPDISIYNTIIRLACKLGEVEECIRLWNEIEATKQTPQVNTFIFMINGFVGKGRLVEACDYFKEMVTRGLVPVLHYKTSKTVLKALLREEKLEMAKDIWKCIMTKGCEVSECGWTIWIHELFSNRYDKEACSYFIDMLDSDLMPQPDTFAKLMRALKERDCIEIAAEITEKVRKMAKKRKITFKMYKRRCVTLLKKKTRVKLKAIKERDI